MLLFIFFIVVQGIPDTAKEIGNFCLPSTLIHYQRDELFNLVDSCLKTNYVKQINSTALHAYVDAYQQAWTSKKQTDVQDDLLYYAKRDLMDEIRDIQLKTTHQMHAVTTCADISKRMPVDIMNSISSEGKYAEYAADIWQHHIDQDIKHCKRILLVDSRQHNQHMIHHMFDTLMQYQIKIKQLNDVEVHHLRDRDTMEQYRKDVIRLLV
jgi:Zn-finger domain-containing protein